MDLEAISGAAIVALTSTVVFVLVAKTWLVMSRTVASSPNFADRILHESAQRFRDELTRLGDSKATYLSSALAFALLFAAAYILGTKQLFPNYPLWQLYLQLAVLLAAACFAGFRLINTSLNYRAVKFSRDANIAIGHQLQQMAAGLGRVYHDVPTTAGIVDHVIAGQNGIYAVNVVAERTRKKGDVSLVENQLHLEHRKHELSIVDIAAKSKRLEKELATLLGHKLRVRSVIAVPGWNIAAQLSDTHLLVNERTLSMLGGWKDSSDHLMNEDVDQLHHELTQRCQRSG